MKFVVPYIKPELRNERKPIEKAKKLGDAALLADIQRCEEMDEDYAPIMDRIRTISGLEYEYRLQRELRTAGILFEVEDDLRGLGYSKTPDALLTFPILLYGNDGDEEPRVIRWIDSKAMYGDQVTHAEDNKDQFASYVNRFGEGLVIYWFGYDKAIISIHQGVYVASDFPPLDKIEQI